MGHLQNLHERYENTGLFVYAVAMHPDPSAARRMNRDMGITYTVFQGTDSELGRRYAYG